MKYCTKCGAEVNGRYCSSCGYDTWKYSDRGAKKKWYKLIILLSVLAVLIAAIVVASVFISRYVSENQKFNKVKNVELGMTKAEVLEELGDPYETIEDGRIWRWWDKNYVKAFENLEYSKLLTRKYKNLTIGFSEDGTVIVVYYDTKCPGGSISENGSKIASSAEMKGTVTCKSDGGKDPVIVLDDDGYDIAIEYKDGSIIKRHVIGVTLVRQIDDHYVELEWNDPIGGKCTAKVRINKYIAADPKT